MRRTVFLSFTIALVGSIGLAAPVRSQTIEGQVTDSISGVPVGRGFIVLVDVTGRERVRALTATDGTFYLPTPGPGTYRLRSERIAYRVWESPDFTLTGGQSHTINPIINSLPRQLASIEVTGRPSARNVKAPTRAFCGRKPKKRSLQRRGVPNSNCMCTASIATRESSTGRATTSKQKRSMSASSQRICPSSAEARWSWRGRVTSTLDRTATCSGGRQTRTLCSIRVFTAPTAFGPFAAKTSAAA